MADQPVEQSAGKHLIKKKDLEQKLYKQAMKVGRHLERRRRFLEASASYRKVGRQARNAQSGGLERRGGGQAAKCLCLRLGKFLP